MPVGATLQDAEESKAAKLSKSDAAKDAVDGLSIEAGTVARNPGISPFALDDLLKYFPRAQR